MGTVKDKISFLLLVTILFILPFANATSSADEGGKMQLRTKMTRLEPAFLSVAEKVSHHVKSSASRAAILRARMQKFPELDQDSGTGYQSTMTEVPGGYGMAISLGSPPQEFLAIADTGSDLTWLQAAACYSCFRQASDPYDQDKSSTYGTLSCSSDMCDALGHQSNCSNDIEAVCQYEYQYGDNSFTEGNFSTETITLQTTSGEKIAVPNFAFGVGLQNSVDFYGVDGLVGLGQGPISFPSQLGKTYGKVFSYCLQSIFSDPSTGSPIIFGQSAVPDSTSVQYTALQTSENQHIPTFWFLNLTGLTLNNGIVNVQMKQDRTAGARGLALGDHDQSTIIAAQGGLGTVIDSGTTISMLNPHVYQSLARLLERRVRYPRVMSAIAGLDLCFDVLNDRDPHFPGITLIFQDANWELPKENVFVPVDELGQIWCLAIVPTNQDVQIIGNLQQQNFQVIYDQPNGQLGWIPANCDTI